MLRAARHRFLNDSYETVGLRDIAGDAGVDVALVSRYFGGKEELFREVLRGADPGKFRSVSDAADLPEFLAGLATQPHGPGDREHVERLILILRSASSPVAAQIVRQAFSENVLEPIASLLDGPEAELRASLSLAVLMGTTVLETVMAVEPFCECDREPVRRRLVRVLEAALMPAPEDTESRSRPGSGTGRG